MEDSSKKPDTLGNENVELKGTDIVYLTAREAAIMDALSRSLHGKKLVLDGDPGKYSARKADLEGILKDFCKRVAKPMPEMNGLQLWGLRSRLLRDNFLYTIRDIDRKVGADSTRYDNFAKDLTDNLSVAIIEVFDWHRRGLRTGNNVFDRLFGNTFTPKYPLPPREEILHLRQNGSLTRESLSISSGDDLDRYFNSAVSEFDLGFIADAAAAKEYISFKVVRKDLSEVIRETTVSSDELVAQLKETGRFEGAVMLTADNGKPMPCLVAAVPEGGLSVNVIPAEAAYETVRAKYADGETTFQGVKYQFTNKELRELAYGQTVEKKTLSGFDGHLRYRHNHWSYTTFVYDVNRGDIVPSASYRNSLDKRLEKQEREENLNRSVDRGQDVSNGRKNGIR